MLKINNFSIDVFRQLNYPEITVRLTEILSFIDNSEAEIIVLPYSALLSDLEQEKVLEPQFLLELHYHNQQIIKATNSQKMVVWTSFYGDQQRQLMVAIDGKYYFSELTTPLVVEYRHQKVTISFQEEIFDTDLNIIFSNYHYHQDLQLLVVGGNTCLVNNYEVQVTPQGVLGFLGEVVTSDTWEVQLLGKPYHSYHLLSILIFIFHYYHHYYLRGRFAWVIGLSGGIDSAVSCYLLSRVVPQEQIFAYNISSFHNREVTKNNAQILAQRLGINLTSLSLEPLLEATLNTVGEMDDLGLQNVQARLRGHLLATMAARHQALIINNGNKVEVVVGYATMYGDMVGSIACLGDLTKQEIIALVREINREQEIIPANLVPQNDQEIQKWEMPPSAELTAHQFDPMKWYYHDYLITKFSPRYNLLSLMRDYYYHQLPQELEQYLYLYHLDEPQLFVKDLQFLLESYQRNRFKHRYYPPSIIVSSNPVSQYRYFFDNFDFAQFEYWKQQICTKFKY